MRICFDDKLTIFSNPVKVGHSGMKFLLNMNLQFSPDNLPDILQNKSLVPLLTQSGYGKLNSNFKTALIPFWQKVEGVMQLQIFNKLEDLSILLFVLLNNDTQQCRKRFFYHLNQRHKKLCQKISEAAFRLSLQFHKNNFAMCFYV